MKTRRLAPVALAAAVVLGTTGCSMISPQATTIDYPPSDGISAHVGDLKIRNALVVATEDGSDGNLAVAVVNESSREQTLMFEIKNAQETLVGEIPVAGGGRVMLGSDYDEPLLLEGIDTEPGSMIEFYFSAAGEEGTAVMVPVLDGTLPEYAPLVPEPSRASAAEDSAD